MGKRSRKPHLSREPEGGKQPRLQQDPEGAYFRWRCDQPDFGGPWGWHLVHPCDLHQRIMKQLHNCESRTWLEVQQGKKSGSGSSVPVQELHAKARARLARLGIGNDHLFELKLDGSSVGTYPRVWGIRLGQTLNILWWDPEHEIYHTEANKNETRKKNKPIKKRVIPDNAECPLAAATLPGTRCPYCSVRDATDSKTN